MKQGEFKGKMKGITSNFAFYRSMLHWEYRPGMENEGSNTIQMRPRYCACEKCRAGLLKDCEMKHIAGEWTDPINMWPDAYDLAPDLCTTLLRDVKTSNKKFSPGVGDIN